MKKYIVETPEGLAFEFDAAEVHDLVVHDSGVLTVERALPAGNSSFAPSAWTRWYIETEES